MSIAELSIAEPSIECPYAEPVRGVLAEDCEFYHTMEVPGHGLVRGQWDLRDGVDAYLGGVDVRGKRVLEVGAADGYLGFQMEERGAEVVGYDLSDRETWDVVPFARTDHRAFADSRKGMIRRLNNGYWFCHQAFGSRARIVFGSVYAIPESIGPVDVATFGSILLHVRDPFLALQNALRLTRETAIVTEPIWDPELLQDAKAGPALARHGGAAMFFAPNHEHTAPLDTWWSHTPDLIRRFLGVLGFEDAEVRYHTQQLDAQDRPIPCFTVVGRRTHGV